ncbi:hypothetical protein U1Q18_024786 [Sarracenia purpurea var. burkii]
MRSVEVPAFGMTARLSPLAPSQDPHGHRSPESLLERLVFYSFFGSPMGYSRRPRRTGATPEGRVDPALLGLVPGLNLLCICAMTLRASRDTKTNLDPASPTRALSRSAGIRDDGSIIPFGSLTGLIWQPILSFDLKLGSDSGWICNQDPHGHRSPESLLERLVFSSFFDSPMGYSRRPRRTGATPKGRVDPALLGLVPGLNLLCIYALTLKSKISAG